MGIRRHLSYANVTATLALVLAMGAGGAYAVERFGSEDIRNDSLLSEDLRDGLGVRGQDVARGTVGAREVREAGLRGTTIVPTAGSSGATCEPSASYTNCIAASLRLATRGRVIAIATGAYNSGLGASEDELQCQVRLDGRPQLTSQFPGVTDGGANSGTDGFARTALFAPVAPGRHTLSLACRQLDGTSAVVDSPTIVAFGIGTGRG